VVNIVLQINPFCANKSYGMHTWQTS
jgi:hypothetical protein